MTYARSSASGPMPGGSGSSAAIASASVSRRTTGPAKPAARSASAAEVTRTAQPESAST